MVESRILQELLGLLGRREIPVDVRSAIADELGKRQYLPAKALLLEGLTDPNPNMRSACIGAVGFGMELREAAPTLVEILLNDELEHIRIDAAYAIGVLRYKPALSALKQVILDERYDMTLREAAFKAMLAILGKERNEESAEDFLRPVEIDWDLVRKL